jgi:hypothetical protein
VSVRAGVFRGRTRVIVEVAREEDADAFVPVHLGQRLLLLLLLQRKQRTGQQTHHVSCARVPGGGGGGGAAGRPR